MISDPIGDMLSQVKNGYMAGKGLAVMPWSRMREGLAKILTANKYLLGQEIKETNGRKELVINLKYDNKVPAVTSLRRVSKPGRRLYVGKNNLPKVLGGRGMAVISTPMGLMTDKEARKKGLGGEVICEVW